MRGNPLLRSTAMAVLLAVLAALVWRVTARAGPNAATFAPTDATTTVTTVPTKITSQSGTSVHVEADFAPAPQQFTLKYLGQVLANVDHPGSHWEGDISLGARNDPTELVIEANWPDGTKSSALRLQLQAPGPPALDKTFWSDGHLLEVVQLP